MRYPTQVPWSSLSAYYAARSSRTRSARSWPFWQRWQPGVTTTTPILLGLTPPYSGSSAVGVVSGTRAFPRGSVVPFLQNRSYTTQVLGGSNSNDHLGEDELLMPTASMIVVDNEDDHDDTILPLEWQPRETRSRQPQDGGVGGMDPHVQEFLLPQMPADPQAVRNDSVVVQVLQESLELLQQQHAQGKAASVMPLTESMQQIFELWRTQHVQNITQPRTSRPFEILLETWSLLATSHHGKQSFIGESKEQNDEQKMDANNPGIQAMHVLQRWYELLAGNLELKPHLEHYNQALGVLAKVSTNTMMAQQQQQQARRTKGAPQQQQQQLDLLVSLASDAQEVVQNLDHWGFSVAPTLQTYSHLVRCLAPLVTTLQPEENNHDTAARVDDWTTAWRRLETAMKEGVETLAAKRILDSPKAKSMFTFARTEDPETLYYYTRALCDALVATQAVRDRNRRLAQRVPVVVWKTNDERVDGSDQKWQRWGVALVEQVLNRPERMAAILQYEKELQARRGNNNNNNETLPEIYETLVGGCEAWQSFLHSHMLSTSSQEVNKGVVSMQIHHVLECLEGLSQHLDKNQQEEAYVALLRGYLWAIKALHPKFADPDKKDATTQLRDSVLQRWLQKHQIIMSQCDSWAPETETGQTIDNLQQDRHEDRKLEASSLPDEDWFKLQRQRQCAAISSNMLMRGMAHVGRVQIVEDMWRAMVKRGLPLDAGTYGVVIKALAYSKKRDAAPQAHKLLEQLDAEWKNRDNLSGAEAAVPIHADHYASVLVAWSQSTLREPALKRALQVFHQLQQNFRMALERRREDYAMSLQPKPFHYYVVLTILAKVRDRDKHAFVDSCTVQVVRQLIEDFPPKKRTAVACRVALFALLKVATLEGAELSQILLDDMQSVFEKENVHEMRPTVVDYAKCMHTWARAAANGQAKGAHLRNQELLQRLESEFIASGYDPSFLPNNVVYLAVVRAIVSTQQTSVADQTEELLKRMLEKAAIGQAEPPLFRFYNDVIFARAEYAGPHCGERAEAILRLMKEYCDSEGILEAKPTAYTYHGVIRAWSRGTDPDKAAHAERLLAEMHDLFRKHEDMGAKADRNVYAAVLQACVHTPRNADANQRGSAVRIALQTLVDMREHLRAPPTSFMYNLVLHAVHRNVEDHGEKSRIASVVFQQCCEEGLVDGGVERALEQCAPHLYRKIPKDHNAKNRVAVPPEWTRNVKKTSTMDRHQR